MHQFDFKDKTAVITGGAQGFGLDVAKKFLSSGAKVFIWDIDENELIKATKEINNSNLEYDLVDVSNFKQIENTVNKIITNNKIDILINNAGITGPTTELWNYNNDDWNKIIEINLHGTFYCCKTIVPYMLKQKYGRIVNIASVSGKDGNANASAYSSAKAGVIGLTKSLGKELATYNIAVNAVTPAGAKTRILNQAPSKKAQALQERVNAGETLKPGEQNTLRMYQKRVKTVSCKMSILFCLLLFHILH